MRRTRARMPLGYRIVAIAAVVLPLAWLVADFADRKGNEHRLARIATQIAGREVHVHCPGPLGRIGADYDTLGGTVDADADGQPVNETKLRTAPCAELDALAGGDRAAELACVERSTSCGDDAARVAWAVDTITHEAFHMKGIRDEALTECSALQTLAWTATQLGATEAQAQGLARLHWEQNYPLMPDQYRVSACQDGGPMDLRPNDPRWPS
jgi:hypothetical protein